MSVPVELGGGPIGALDVYAVGPRGWDDTEVSALQTYAGVVASLRRAARSSGRNLSEVAAEVAAGRPLPRGRTPPTPTQAEQPNGDVPAPYRPA